jgi:hypothetical protein
MLKWFIDGGGLPELVATISNCDGNRGDVNDDDDDDAKQTLYQI